MYKFMHLHSIFGMVEGRHIKIWYKE